MADETMEGNMLEFPIADIGKITINAEKGILKIGAVYDGEHADVKLETEISLVLLLKMLSERTDNKIDDTIVGIVEKYLQ